VLSFPGSLKVYVAVEPCDMRKSFQGLSELTGNALKQDVRSGALFVFGNRPRNRLKILYWDGSGLWVLNKRLERGSYSWPRSEQPAVELRPQALAMLTDGVQLHGARMRPWYDVEKD
jgi:transposase